MSTAPAVNSRTARADKAEQTSTTASAIIAEEQKASDTKVAKLKALRLAREAVIAPESVKARRRRR